MAEAEAECKDEKNKWFRGAREQGEARVSGAGGAKLNQHRYLTLPGSRSPATSTSVEDVDAFYNARAVIDTARQVTDNDFVPLFKLSPSVTPVDITPPDNFGGETEGDEGCCQVYKFVWCSSAVMKLDERRSFNVVGLILAEELFQH